jgi:hypothetical protein
MVYVLGTCWSRPGLIARELAWRWLFGVPALALMTVTARKLAAALLSHGGLPEFSLLDPAGSARSLRMALGALAPELHSLLLWSAPLLLGWAVASGAGRSFVLRALEPSGNPRPLAMMLLQLLRLLALASAVLTWAALVRWAARSTLLHIAPGAEPNAVAFAAWLICLSLGVVTAWAVCSWVLTLAAVLLTQCHRSLRASIREALRIASLTSRLVEVNLVLTIVKLALIVLAMVFCSIPLPFESVMSGMALYVWWGFVGVLYLAASDFFQVVRLAAFLSLWKRAQQQQLHL